MTLADVSLRPLGPFQVSEVLSKGRELAVFERLDASEVLQPFWARLLKWIVAILSLPMAMKATAFCVAA